MTKHCEKCFDYLDTKLELDTKLCIECMEDTDFLCASYFCNKCRKQLTTDFETDTNMCNKCYDGPRYFTFFDWEIEEFFDEQERLEKLKIACEKRKREREQRLKKDKLRNEKNKVLPRPITDVRKSLERLIVKQPWNKY